jgi:hypothetical protein
MTKMRAKVTVKTASKIPYTFCMVVVWSKFIPNTPVTYALKPIATVAIVRVVFAISNSFREVSSFKDICDRQKASEDRIGEGKIGFEIVAVSAKNRSVELHHCSNEITRIASETQTTAHTALTKSSAFCMVTMRYASFSESELQSIRCDSSNSSISSCDPRIFWLRGKLMDG